jgi:hypothetical protein
MSCYFLALATVYDFNEIIFLNICVNILVQNKFLNFFLYTMYSTVEKKTETVLVQTELY